MSVRFKGDLDYPDWVMIRMYELSKLSLDEFKLLNVQVTKAMTNVGKEQETLDVTKLKGLCSQAGFVWNEIKDSTAAIYFIINNAGRNNIPVDELGVEIQQMGLPKEYADNFRRIYVDYVTTVRITKGYGIINHRVYIGRFTDEVKRKDLIQFLVGSGHTKDVRLMTRFAFVEYDSREEAALAVKNLNGRFLKGTKVRVDHATAPRTKGESEDIIVLSDEAHNREEIRLKPILKGVSVDYKQLSLKSPFGRHAPMSKEHSEELSKKLREMDAEFRAKYCSGRRLSFL